MSILPDRARLCEDLQVPYRLVPVPIYEIVFVHRKEKNPCSLCAKLAKNFRFQVGVLPLQLMEQHLHLLALGGAVGGARVLHHRQVQPAHRPPHIPLLYVERATTMTTRWKPWS